MIVQNKNNCKSKFYFYCIVQVSRTAPMISISCSSTVNIIIIIILRVLLIEKRSAQSASTSNFLKQMASTLCLSVMSRMMERLAEERPSTLS